MPPKERVAHLLHLLEELRRRGRRLAGAATPAAAPRSEAVTTRLSQARPRAVEWLWPGRVATGKYALLCGDPGLGKSLLAVDLIARLTSGRPAPEGGPARPPASVLLLSAEDDAEDTLLPRLQAAGGDPDRVHLIHGVRDLPLPARPPFDPAGDQDAHQDDQDDQDAHYSEVVPLSSWSAPSPLLDDQDLPSETVHLGHLGHLGVHLGPPPADGAAAEPVPRFLNLKRDLAALEPVVRQTRAALLVIDPLSAYLSGADSHVDAEVRGVLGPLAAFAARHHLAVLGICHLNKNLAGSALYRVVGSIAFVAAARTAHLVVADRDDPTRRRRLLLPIKSNLGPLPPGLAYTIDSQPLRSGENPAAAPPASAAGETAATVPVLAWDPTPLPLTAADYSAAASEERPPPAGNLARDFLLEVLAAGPQPALRVQALARDRGLSLGILRRAGKALGVRHYRLPRSEDPDSPWMWALPEEAGPRPPPA